MTHSAGTHKVALAAVIAAMAIAALAESVGSLSPGAQSRWSLDFRAQLDQSESKSPVEIHLTGDWTSTITDVRPHEYTAAIQLANAQVSGVGAPNVTAAALAEFQKRVGRTFWATYREDGALLAVHFFRDVDPGDQNLLQMIVTEAQLVRGESDSPEWTSLERDGAGTYLAAYRKTGPTLLTKHKVKYVEAGGQVAASTAGLHLDVEQSDLRFSLDADGAILSLDGTDRARIKFAISPKQNGQDQGVLTATSEIHLAKLRRSQAPGLIGSLEQGGRDVVDFPIITHNQDPARTRARSDEFLLDGHTTASLLEAATAANGDRTLSDRLVALFRERPVAAREAVAVLRETGPHKLITEALAAAGSSSAIDALRSLTADRTILPPVRLDALSALVLLHSPDPNAMRIPVALLDDTEPEIRSLARIMSGALARIGRTGHSAEADAIDRALIERYHKTDEPKELSNLIAALGNSGGPATLRVVEEAMGSAFPSLRAAAARALRLAPGPEVDRLLAKAIRSDPEPSVRSDAIFAAGFRRPLNPQIGEALMYAAKSDSADYVRSNAITLLRRNPEASPEIAETLSWIAANDAKPGIRRLAGEAISSTTSANQPAHVE